MDTVIISPVVVRVKLRHIEMNVKIGTHLVYITYPGGGSSCSFYSITYHLLAAIFTGAPLLQVCHEVVSFRSLKSIRNNLGVFVVHPPHPITDRVLRIAFRRIFMDRSSGIVSHSCCSFQFFKPLPIKKPFCSNLFYP